MRGCVQTLLAGATLACAVLAPVGALAQSEIGAPCLIKGNEAAILTAFTEAGWSLVPSDPRQIDPALLAMVEIDHYLMGEMALPWKMDTAEGYDALIAYTHGEGLERYRNRQFTSLRHPDGTVAALTYEASGGISFVVCHIAGPDLSEVPPAIEANWGRYSQGYPPNVRLATKPWPGEGFHTRAIVWMVVLAPEGATDRGLVTHAVRINTDFTTPAGN